VTGVLIINVEPGSGAAKAGLRGTKKDSQGKGDIITAVDGEPVKSVDDLLTILGEKKAGQTVRVTFIRGEDRDTVEVTLQ
jgi:S1-C subfamily serine protease